MEYDDRTPIYLQIMGRLQRQMIRGDIQPGDRLPSVRTLAREYGVNPNTAARVYREMEALGLCSTRRGLGTFATGDPAGREAARQRLADALVRNFIRDMTDLGYSAREINGAVVREEMNQALSGGR